MSVRDPTSSAHTLAQLRHVTGAAHMRLEQRLGAIERFSDPLRRMDLIRRFAAFHLPAEHALTEYLIDIPDLDFRERSRTALLQGAAGNRPLPDFPVPDSCAEALGMFYVLEGSTLGGRLILRTLADRGADVSGLAFLDPYGAETGRRWRGFLRVLERETAGDEVGIRYACRGAVSAFEHAESVLCGGAA